MSSAVTSGGGVGSLAPPEILVNRSNWDITYLQILQYLIDVIGGLGFGVELNNGLSNMNMTCERLRPPETDALFPVSPLHMCSCT